MNITSAILYLSKDLPFKWVAYRDDYPNIGYVYFDKALFEVKKEFGKDQWEETGSPPFISWMNVGELLMDLRWSVTYEGTDRLQESIADTIRLMKEEECSK